MQYALSHTLNYGETDERFEATLEAVANLFQEAALGHAAQVGFGADRSWREGWAWVMHKLGLQIARLPKGGEVVTVSTWSNGIEGFRGLREFRLHTAGGEELVRGSSIWVHFDTVRRVPLRVPPRVAAAFSPLTGGEVAFPYLSDLRKQELAAGAWTTEITTRFSDFDSNAHVNHPVYLDYLQTALTEHAGGNVRIAEVQLLFAREIARDVRRFEARIAPENPGRWTVALHSAAAGLHACATVQLHADPAPGNT